MGIFCGISGGGVYESLFADGEDNAGYLLGVRTPFVHIQWN